MLSSSPLLYIRSLFLNGLSSSCFFFLFKVCFLFPKFSFDKMTFKVVTNKWKLYNNIVMMGFNVGRPFDPLLFIMCRSIIRWRGHSDGSTPIVGSGIGKVLVAHRWVTNFVLVHEIRIFQCCYIVAQDFYEFHKNVITMNWNGLCTHNFISDIQIFYFKLVTLSLNSYQIYISIICKMSCIVVIMLCVPQWPRLAF